MKTTVTLTGTGTPRPTAGRAGAGTLIQCGSESIQIDAGRGTVLRLAEADMPVESLDALFLTHHHSDHLVAVPDLLISRWVMGATQSLDVVAPAGPLTDFGKRVLDLWDEDEQVRRTHTGRPAIPRPNWLDVDPCDRAQLVWEGAELRVEMVRVEHQPVEPAVAYRVEARDGTVVVVSGDTRVCEQVEQVATGADLLVHEAVRPALLGAGRGYISEYHAECEQLGAMAERAGVKSLVLTHLEPAPSTREQEQGFIDDVRRGGYVGDLAVGRDLWTVELSS
ncbi:MBL fold metallo-hydrolase [Aeromicrobium sp. CTD01-1L150]|uniref:MBL fold metallo-hydrolase n=1 Tax=Aeromicrobium sp. CTD01-1L150 TaxID=3341830 RepID=UPI0035C0B493